jgi:hypothetical protein
MRNMSSRSSSRTLAVCVVAAIGCGGGSHPSAGDAGTSAGQGGGAAGRTSDTDSTFDSGAALQTPDGGTAGRSDARPRLKISWSVRGTSPLGTPWDCESLNLWQSAVSLTGPDESGIDFTNSSTCSGMTSSDVLINAPVTDANGGPPVLGNYYYNVSLEQQFEVPIASKHGTFVLGKDDVSIHVEFVFLTVPVAWKITQAGMARTCEEVGATQIRFRYKEGGWTTKSTTACKDESSTVIFPLTPGTYEDVGADLLDADDHVVASWEDSVPYVLTESNPAAFPSPDFAL